MKILVIGATGLTGQHVLKHLEDTSHAVTAFVRSPAKLAKASASLNVIQGDARDAVAIENAILGQHAVIATIGQNTLRKDDVQEIIMRNLVAAMSGAGVKRLVNLSAMAAGDSLEGTEFFMRWIMLPLLLQNVYDDKNKGEACIFKSKLDYVNVRPGRLNNGPAVGGVKASLTYDGIKVRKMSREDLAIFMISQHEKQEWVRKSVLIGY